jgi:hypothetical protein
MIRFTAIAVLLCGLSFSAIAGNTSFSTKIKAEACCQNGNSWIVTLSDPNFESLTKDRAIVTIDGKKYVGHINSGKIIIKTIRSQEEADIASNGKNFLVVEI